MGPCHIEHNYDAEEQEPPLPKLQIVNPGKEQLPLFDKVSHGSVFVVRSSKSTRGMPDSGRSMRRV